MDVAVGAEREALLDEASEHFAAQGVTMSVLVNNVGTNIRKPTVEYTEEEWDRLLSTNLQSTFHLSQLAHPLYAALTSVRVHKVTSDRLSDAAWPPPQTPVGEAAALSSTSRPFPAARLARRQGRCTPRQRPR